MTDNATAYRKPTTLMKNKQPKVCECGRMMKYSGYDGSYTCDACGYRELDLFGKMKELLDMYPNLTKMELSVMLGEPMKNINPYIENGHLVNNDIY
jgi:hypothetical protein